MRQAQLTACFLSITVVTLSNPGCARDGGAAFRRAVFDGDLPRVKALFQKRHDLLRMHAAGSRDLGFSGWFYLSALERFHQFHDDQFKELEKLGYSPLHLAVHTGNQGMCEFLLKEGADVEDAAAGGFKPLHIAVIRGHLTIVEELIRRGASVNSADARGWTALRLATASRQHRVMQVLLEHKANPDRQDRGGFGPLHIAADSGDERAVRLLLSFGADVSLKTNLGRTAAGIAVASRKEGVLRLLTTNRLSTSLSASSDSRLLRNEIDVLVALINRRESEVTNMLVQLGRPIPAEIIVPVPAAGLPEENPARLKDHLETLARRLDRVRRFQDELWEEIGGARF